MGKTFKGKNIMITGGAGSFGLELTRYLLGFNPEVIRIYDNDEERLFHIQQELGDDKEIRYLVGDIRDKTRLDRAMEDINFVFHCAALKHVASCEYNPFEAVKTNVLATQNLIDVSLDADVDKVLFTSTDKAANPTNVMGTSKLLAERLMVAANYYKGYRKTIFSCVRFGNVIGSSGSVIPLFRDQIKERKPVTITDPNMTRFIISLEEAVGLVVKSMEMAHGGEIFILKMPALRLGDLAEVMISKLPEKYGYSSKEVVMKTIGVKPGEKHYEDLMTNEELTRSLETDDLFIILPQITELMQSGLSNHSSARKPKVSSYTSENSQRLTKEEISQLLEKEGVL